MTLYSEQDLSWRPPWYWAPYVYGLGIKDWWKEALGRKHKEVLKTGLAQAKKNKHRLFRLVSSMVLVFLLYLLIAKWVLAPAIVNGYIDPSSSELLWASVLIAAFSIGSVAIAVLRRLKRGTDGLYARGLNVLRARRALLYREG